MKTLAPTYQTDPVCIVVSHNSTLLGCPAVCADCGRKLVLDVHRSAAGYYIGTYCNCGPYSRESDYFSSHERAIVALTSGF